MLNMYSHLRSQNLKCLNSISSSSILCCRYICKNYSPCNIITYNNCSLCRRYRLKKINHIKKN